MEMEVPIGIDIQGWIKGDPGHDTVVIDLVNAVLIL